MDTQIITSNKIFPRSFNKTDDAPFTEHARDLSSFGTFRLTIELELTGISFTNFPLAFFLLSLRS